MTNIDTKRETNFAVTLTPSSFGTNTYVARVPRKTVTTDQILDLVVAHNKGIDRFQVAHAMELLKKEILEQAELGFSVDIMEICKLYLAPLHGVRSLMPESETVTGFEARFAVNDRLRKRLGGMTAAVTAVVDPAPQISLIENPVAKDGEPKDVLKATFSARLTGRKLKVGGEGGGIFFVPAVTAESPGSEEMLPSKNEGDWIKVPDDFVTHNADKHLEFYLPRDLESGRNYFIAVRATERNGVALKNPSTGMSRVPVMVGA